VTVSTFVTLLFFDLGGWAVGAALGAAEVWTGLVFPVGLDAAEETAADLVDAALTGVTGLGVALTFAAVVFAFAAGLSAALAINILALATGAFDFSATADLPGGFAFFEVFTSCLLAVSKGRVPTVCPWAADRKPVHVLFKPLLLTLWGSPASPKGVAVGGRL
jgi:hypothetical protein